MLLLNYRKTSNKRPRHSLEHWLHASGVTCYDTEQAYTVY